MAVLISAAMLLGKIRELFPVSRKYTNEYEHGYMDAIHDVDKLFYRADFETQDITLIDAWKWCKDENICLPWGFHNGTEVTDILIELKRRCPMLVPINSFRDSTARQQLPTGEWIVHGAKVTASCPTKNCNTRFRLAGKKNLDKYCPNCGQKLDWRALESLGRLVK